MYKEDSLNFMELCLQGKALPEEIDDYIDAWHEGDSDESLHEYLGMSSEEYSLWIKNPNAIHSIIEEYHNNRKTSSKLAS